MRTNISPAVSITSESILEDLVTPLHLNLKNRSSSECNGLSAALCKFELQHQTFFAALLAPSKHCHDIAVMTIESVRECL